MNEGGAAGCVSRIQGKFCAKRGVQITGMIFRHALGSP
ncbi:MAG: DUF6783 domain-containing protein [Lachnospiraceae bacterium]